MWASLRGHVQDRRGGTSANKSEQEEQTRYLLTNFVGALEVLVGTLVHMGTMLTTPGPWCFSGLPYSDASLVF